MQRMIINQTDHVATPSHERAFLSILLGCVVVTSVVPLAGGCSQGRLLSPMASRRSLDHSPPSMHGPSLHGPAMQGPRSQDEALVSGDGSTPANQTGTVNMAKPASHRSASRHRDGGVQITSENALPETSIQPVEQRLTPTRPAVTNASAVPPQQFADALIAPVSHVTTFNGTEAPASLQLPEGFDGVDVSGLIEALQDSPPEVQKAAIARLIAMSRQRATPSAQPQGIDEALVAAFDNLPELPTEVVDRGINPIRIGNANPPIKTPSRKAQANTVPQQHAASVPSTVQNTPLNATQNIVQNAVHESFSDQTADPAPVEEVNMSLSDQSGGVQQVSLAKMQTPVVNSDVTATPSTDVEPISTVATLTDAEVSAPPEMTDAELFDELVARLQATSGDENDADRQRRQVVARHLMVLAGDPDRAVDDLDGLTKDEQEFLRNQLLGLWTIIDPNGHPVPSRRFSSALPAIRKAASHLAAASDSLEVRSLEFCTEIEAYGQIKPFPQRRFTAGQEVILYCEIENFVADPVQSGFETRLQGSYDLLDVSGRRISSQTLPEDLQVSKVQLRDYFIAYQMYLPDAIEPGKYQLRLTMEDMHGKKYGQSTVDFEIKR